MINLNFEKSAGIALFHCWSVLHEIQRQGTELKYGQLLAWMPVNMFLFFVSGFDNG